MFCFARPAEFKEGRFTIEFETQKFYFYRVFFDKNKTEYALKIYKDTNEANRSYLREKTILAKLSNQHIMKLGPHKFLSKAIQKNHLLVEYAQQKDMFYLLHEVKRFKENIARTYFRQLLKGLEHMHSLGIAHMDIKLENLFLDKDYVLKIGDFDLAQYFEEKTQKGRGTKNYRAPEVITKKCANFEAADIYSAGIVLFLMIFGRFPFSERKEENIIQLDFYHMFQENIQHFWEYHETHSKLKISEDLKLLFEAMLELDPTKRPDIQEIKDSAWYRGKTLNKKNQKKEILETLDKARIIQ